MLPGFDNPNNYFMINRTSFLFIISFIFASLIMLGVCGLSIYLLKFVSPEIFPEIFITGTGIAIFVGYGLLTFCAYLSVTRLIALYNGKESGARFFFFIALIITIIYTIYVFSKSINGVPLLLLLSLLITWSLYKLFKSFPDEYVDDTYVKY
jgi:hypothetical protein